MRDSENVLNIEDDDSVLIALDLEKVFGIKISDAEAKNCETVGDVFKIVVSKMNVVERDKALPCFSAAAFRTLRQLFLMRDQRVDAGPTSMMSDLLGEENPKQVWRYLEEQSQLTLPPLQQTRANVSVCALIMIISALIGGLIGFEHLSIDFERITVFLVLGMLGNIALAVFVGFLAGLVPAGIASALGPKEIPEEIKTLGDLAEATAKLNVGSLAKRFGAVRNRDVWSSLVYLIDQYNWSKKPIDTDTRFFPQKLDPPAWLSRR